MYFPIPLGVMNTVRTSGMLFAVLAFKACYPSWTL